MRKEPNKETGRKEGKQPGTSQEKVGSASNSKVKKTGHRKRDKKTKGDKL